MQHTVGALLVSERGEVLLGLRADWKRAWPSHWDSIGGRVESGETLEQALVRELGEEIGVRPTLFHHLAEVAEPWPEAHGEAVHHIYAVLGWERPTRQHLRRAH